MPDAEQNGCAGSVTVATRIVAKAVERATEGDDLAGIGVNYKQHITRDRAIEADASLFSRRIETVSQRQSGREDKAVVYAVGEGRYAAIARGQHVMPIAPVKAPVNSSRIVIVAGLELIGPAGVIVRVDPGSLLKMRGLTS